MFSNPEIDIEDKLPGQAIPCKLKAKKLTKWYSMFTIELPLGSEVTEDEITELLLKHNLLLRMCRITPPQEEDRVVLIYGGATHDAC